jgi:hypothetical protein
MGPRGDVIVEFDWSAGKILETLDRLKLAESTLVILSSDKDRLWTMATRIKRLKGLVLTCLQVHGEVESIAPLKEERACLSCCAGQAG